MDKNKTQLTPGQRYDVYETLPNGYNLPVGIQRCSIHTTDNLVYLIYSDDVTDMELCWPYKEFKHFKVEAKKAFTIIIKTVK